MKHKIYAKSVGCFQCKMLIQVCQEKRIDFEIVYVDKDPSTLTELKQHGYKTVPVFCIDGNLDNSFTGFDIDKLEKLKIEGGW